MLEDLDEFWKKSINIIAVVAIVVTTFFLTKAITADHKIRSYYLSTATSTGGFNHPKIVIDIDWQPDEYIIPDRQMSYKEVLELVDSLNASLKK